MPTLSGALTADGALVDLRIGWGATDAQAQRQALRPVPPPLDARGLVGTGAETSCVDPALVHGLGLPIGGITITNVPALGGVSYGMQYKASLVVMHPSGSAGDDLKLGQLVVIELPLAPLGYQALIGRDVLALCDFLYRGQGGTFTLSY
jgi:hypothetical protein